MAKIPIILEAGRADGKLITTNAIFDENKSMFQSELNDIQDTLNSDNPNKPLSANQGRILKGIIDAKVIEVGAVPIDSEPTEGNITHVVNSDSLAKEFNKYNTEIILGGVYDVSSHNNGVVFESLQALLNSSNLSTLIPTSVRHGGMSIRFIQGSEHSSDNKYVQYRLTANEWNTDTNNWAIADEGVYVENPEFVYVKTDAECKILWAIKIDGSIYYGAGLPQQVIDYIEKKIADLSLDEYEDIVAFLNEYLGSDTTLKELIDNKLDAEGLDPDALETVKAVENSEYIQAITDSEDKVLEGITPEGVKLINIRVDTPSATIEHVKNSEWLSVTIDNNGKIINGIKKNTGKYELAFPTNQDAILQEHINVINKKIENINLDDSVNVIMSYGKINNDGTVDSSYKYGAVSNIQTFNKAVYVNMKLTEPTRNNEPSAYRGYKFEVVMYNNDNTIASRTGLIRHDFMIPANVPFRLYAQYNVLQYWGEDSPSVPSSIVESPNDYFIISAESTDFWLPPYWNKNGYLDGKIKVARDLYEECASNGDMFILITDVHYERNAMHSAAIIKYISERLSIDKLINCGDDADGVGYNVYLTYKNAFAGKHYYWTQGNHDMIIEPPASDIGRFVYNITGGEDRPGTGNAIFATHNDLNNNAIFKEGKENRNFYYVDNTIKKIRYVFVNTVGSPDLGYNYTVGEDQLSWLFGPIIDNETGKRDNTQGILYVQEGWTAFIFVHSFFPESSGEYRLIPNAEYKKEFRQAVYTMQTTLINSNRGRIGVVFAGDAHIDCIVGETNGNKEDGQNLPVINTLSDVYDYCQDKDLRSEGNITEQAFDIVVINKTTKTINMVRVGMRARNSRGFTTSAEDIGELVEVRTINY